MVKKGLFVTFEGGEGAGKTTLTSALRDALKAEGREVILTREPGGTPLGEELRSLLLHHKEDVAKKAELLLFLASRIQHIETLIQPALARGAIVLCDRFTDSTIAYQGYARGLDVAYVTSACSLATGTFSPDITFYVDIDPELGLGRTSMRRERSNESADRLEKEALEFHRKVRAGFLALVVENPQRILTLDGTLNPATLFQTAYSVINKFLKS